MEDISKLTEKGFFVPGEWSHSEHLLRFKSFFLSKYTLSLHSPIINILFLVTSEVTFETVCTFKNIYAGRRETKNLQILGSAHIPTGIF